MRLLNVGNRGSKCKEWHPKKNKITAQEITAGSNKKAWWICEKGHEWEANIAARNSGNGCPYCSNRLAGYGNSLADHSAHLIHEIDFNRSNVDPTKIPAGSAQKLWWTCDRGHSYEAPVRRRTMTGSGCRFCSAQTSAPEIRLFCELKSIFGDALGREKLNGVEADVVIPSLKVAIEYDGAYFHSDKLERDRQKTEHFKGLGYATIRLREAPLPLGNNDVEVSPSPHAPTKNEINKLVINLLKGRPEIQGVVKQYVEEDGFVAQREFKRILSYLPGPPE